MDIKLTSIAGSSTVARIGYNELNQTLRVDYHRTGCYDYYGVTLDEFHQIARVPTEESVGKKIKEIIKGKQYSKDMSITKKL